MRILVAMVWKELREHWRAGLIALAGVGGAMLATSTIFDSANLGYGYSAVGSSFSLFTFTTAFAGFLLGLRVVAGDARGDARALAIHRPVSGTTVFAAKAIGASVLYLVATLLPFTLHAAALATPGFRPAPFDARLLLADVADLTCGLAYVATGMLFAIRPPRWLGGRIFSVGAALVASAIVLGVDRFWQAELVVLGALLAIGTAAWSTFIRHGKYESQPIAGRAATGVVMAAGLKIGGAIAFAILVTIVSSGIRKEGVAPRRTTSLIAGDGSVVRVTTLFHPFTGGSEVVAVTDLEGHPLPALLDSASRRRGLIRGVKATAEIPLNVERWDEETFQGNGYRGTQALFVRLQTPPSGHFVPTAWYFIRDRGLVAGYDIRTSRLIGWLGPDGFSAGATEPAHRFEGALRPYSGYMGYTQPFLAFPRDVYRIDLARYSVRHIFSAPSGEEITGAAEARDSLVREIAPTGRIEIDDSDALTPGFDAIATNRAVYVQTPTGETRLVAPRDSSTTNYGSVAVAHATFAEGSPFFLWYRPQNGTMSWRDLRQAPARVVKLSSTGEALAHLTVPRDSFARTPEPKWQTAAESFSTQLVVPIAERAIHAVTAGEHGERTSTTEWIFALIGAVVFGAVNFTLCRRYAFLRGRVVTWTAIGFAFGLLGVALFLMLVERPARERCPACGRKRVVDRERCEHCGAPFPPPQRDGTEIFENGPTVVAEPV